MEIGSTLSCLPSAMLSSQVLIAFSLAVAVLPFMVWLARQPHFPGRRTLIFAHVGVVWWLLMTAFELAVPAASCKILASGLSHAGIALVPIAWVSFIYRFTVGVSDRGRRAQDIMMLVAPLLAAGMALTSGLHGLFYTGATRLEQADQGPFVVYEYGPLFYAQMIFLYVCILLTLALLFRAASKAQASGRSRYWLLFAVATMPTIANGAYLFLGFRFWGIDPTPFMFAAVLLIYVIMMMTDNTLDLAALARQQVFRSLPQAIFVVGSGRQIKCSNEAAQTLLEDRISVAGEQAKAQQEIWSIFSTCRQYSPNRTASVGIGNRFYDIELQKIDRAVGTNQPPLGWVMIATDVTAAYHLQAELSRAARSATADAQQDPLTGLRNRRTLASRFTELIEKAQKNDQVLQVVLIDVDHFKVINDTYGHDAGDKALIDIARALQSVFREEDALFRIGGEEFLAFVVAISRPALIDRLNQARAKVNDTSLHEGLPRKSLTFSAGVADWPTQGSTLEELISKADDLLLAAKRDGRDRFIWQGGVSLGGRPLES